MSRFIFKSVCHEINTHRTRGKKKERFCLQITSADIELTTQERQKEEDTVTRRQSSKAVLVAESFYNREIVIHVMIA